MIKALFEGEFKYSYWSVMNKVFGEPKEGCLCTIREECRTCWTHMWKGWYETTSRHVAKYESEPEIDFKAIEREQIFK